MRRLDAAAASLILPVLDELERLGAPVQRLVESSGLSMRAFESPGSYLPRAATRRFLSRAARVAGDGLISYKASSKGTDRLIETASAPVAGRELPVYERVTRVLALVSRASSGMRLFARVDGDLLWLVRIPPEKREDESWEFEQYAIGALEAIGLRFFGRGVRPRSIRLRSRPSRELMPAHWRDRAVRTYQHHSGISFPLTVLGAQEAGGASHPGRSVTRASNRLNPTDLISAISVYAEDMKHGIDHVADAFGLNRRTFQRRLADHGMTYSGLVEEARFQRALQMLQSPEVTVTDLAMESGYGSPENFTRAFRRRYGLPPRQFRQLLRQRLGDPSLTD